ncbi:MAG: hypothetical protein J0M24_19945 [Verrucomicrobia bacterium]|jgi:hypothetical protein|nr:hypothetical protein [Verrucomicrobiota bacterium]
MKRPPTTPDSQFTLALHREPPLQFDELKRQELLNVLADLFREALRGDPSVNEGKQEDVDEPKDHA